MRKTRRALLQMAALGLPVVALAGCATSTTGTTTTTTVPVTLAGAQAEAGAILAALQTFAATFGKTLAAAGQADLTKGMTALTGAVTAFQGIPSGANLTQYVAAVVNAATVVVALLPLPPATQIAITAGLALLQALVAGLATVTVTVPATSTTTASVSATKAGVAAPIAIPLS